MNTISKWPKKDRPREKLLQNGAEALSDTELLSILLRHGTKGKTALDIAREIYNDCGGITGLFSIDYKEFTKKPGLGLAKFAQIRAAQELSSRYMMEKLKTNGRLKNIADVKKILLSKYKRLTVEVFSVIFLNSRNHLICFEKMFTGTVNGAAVYIREIIKRTIYHNAVSIILAHNHPSGVHFPGKEDIDITKAITTAMQLIGINVIDHIIISGNKAYSFSEDKLI